MAEVFGALVPTFILIALGYIVRAAKIATAEQFGMVNRFGYFVLYPAFLFTLISQANLAAADAGPFLIGLLAGVLALMLVALSTRFLFRDDGPAFTELILGWVP